MNVFDSARLILYRCHEKGLEVLLIKPDLKEDDSVWKIPNGYFDTASLDGIELSEEKDASGFIVRTIAVEADWHEIPSVRGIIKHDLKRLKKKVKNKVLPTFDNCNYISVKEALKEVLPDEYQALKELKDIIVDRNLMRSI